MPAPEPVSGSPLLAGTSPEFRARLTALAQQGLDVVFVLDATDSMVPAIDHMKERLPHVMRGLSTLLGEQAAGQTPAIRFGVVAFKDDGDDYGPGSVRTRPLTADAEAVARFVNALAADGGGDLPEPLQEALRAATDARLMGWRRGPACVIVLVSDAPGKPGKREDAATLAKLFVRRYAGEIHTIDTSAAKPGANPANPAKPAPLQPQPDLLDIATQGAGSATLLHDMSTLWHQTLLTVLGSRFEADLTLVAPRLP